MDLEQIEIPLSVDALYRLLGEEQIMSYYMKTDINLKKRYTNPFRDDKTPGCFFRWSSGGRLYFVDYGTAQTYYSCLDIAVLVTGYSFPDVLYKIESDFNIKDLNLSDKNRLVLEL